MSTGEAMVEFVLFIVPALVLYLLDCAAEEKVD